LKSTTPHLLLISLVFGVLLSSNRLNAQNPLHDANAVFLTDDGYLLDKEKAAALLDSELFYITRKKDSVGNHRYIFKRYNTAHKNASDTLFIEKFTNEPMPYFQLVGLNKVKKEPEDYLGKPTVYNFWFTSCKPCIEEMPLLNKLVRQYQDSVNFVAFTFENFNKVNSFLEKTNFDYEIFPNAESLTNELNISSYPVHIITDSQGIIQKAYFGGSNIIDLEIELAIKSLLPH